MCNRVLICSTVFAPPTKVEQIGTRVLICTGVYIVHMNEALDVVFILLINVLKNVCILTFMSRINLNLS